MNQPQLPVPPPLRGAEAGSFAEMTIRERLPRIARQVLVDNTLTPTAVDNIQALLDSIPYGHIEALPEADGPDQAAWQAYITPYLGHDWLQVPWFFAETYFYRRIIAATNFFATALDPFALQKQQSLEATLTASRALAAQLNALLPAGWQAESLRHLLLLALWGNQADLSLWAAHDTSQPSHRDNTSQEAHLLVNDAERVVRHLGEHPAGRIDIILDNAGFELVGDLCLVDYLLNTQSALAVRLHTKLHPTFVSDAINADVQTTVALLAQDTDTALQAMGQRLQRGLNSRRLQLRTQPFWTSPLPMWDMPPELRQELAEAHLVISKGDANYRRALGDAHWPFHTPFADIVSYLPAPTVFLRTCKSEVIAGLAAGQAAALAQRDPAWLVNGEWGVLQFVAGIGSLRHRVALQGHLDT